MLLFITRKLIIILLVILKNKKTSVKYPTYMNTHAVEIYVVQKFMVKLNRETGTEKNHHFLLPILFQECEK